MTTLSYLLSFRPHFSSRIKLIIPPSSTQIRHLHPASRLQPPHHPSRFSHHKHTKMPNPDNNRKGGRGNRGGGGSGNASREVQVSKALSYLLRHAAEREGLKIDAQGYANVADVMAWRKLKSLKVTFLEIIEAVETSDKKRFALFYTPPSISAIAPQPTTEDETAAEASIQNESSEEEQSATTPAALAASKTDQTPSHYLIRATQGHSIKSVEAEALLEKLTLDNPEKLPDTVVHGTYHSTWPLILASGGLRCMGRNHVHFATGPGLGDVLGAVEGMHNQNKEKIEGEGAGSGPGAAGKVISGMRQDAQVLVYIDIRRALAGGCPFWRSENGVILSEGMESSSDKGKGEEGKVIPVEFFDVVVERRRGLGKIWEGGETLQELPEELTSRRGPKGGGGKRGGRRS
ncbi:KptA family-domain-containing protein [Aspergillus karnatakaensis]|uniref:tRNA 2'-phosphotransferase n=1 Tax=Aspergillus karnatakaensis TaxID=1810916 RepID=UPI003CCD12F0